MMKEGQRAKLPPEGYVGSLIFDEMSIQVIIQCLLEPTFFSNLMNIQ
jgi:hypothetical protein